MTKTKKMKTSKKPTKKPLKRTKKAPAVSTSAASATEESEASVSVVRAWLADDDFHEDPTGESPDRIEILGPGYDGVSREHYVDVRVYVPQIDIESEIEGEGEGEGEGGETAA